MAWIQFFLIAETSLLISIYLCLMKRCRMFSFYFFYIPTCSTGVQFIVCILLFGSCRDQVTSVLDSKCRIFTVAETGHLL